MHSSLGNESILKVPGPQLCDGYPSENYRLVPTSDSWCHSQTVETANIKSALRPLSKRTQFRAAGSQKGIHKSSIMSTSDPGLQSGGPGCQMHRHFLKDLMHGIPTKAQPPACWLSCFTPFLTRAGIQWDLDHPLRVNRPGLGGMGPCLFCLWAQSTGYFWSLLLKPRRPAERWKMPWLRCSQIQRLHYGAQHWAHALQGRLKPHHLHPRPGTCESLSLSGKTQNLSCYHTQ